MLGRIQRLGVRAPILLVGGIAMTMALDPVLSCVLMATMPLLTIVVVLVSRKSIPMFAALQDSTDRFVRTPGSSDIPLLSKSNARHNK